MARINAAELEALVTDAVQTHCHVQPRELARRQNDRDLICQRVERIIVSAQSIDIHLFNAEDQEPDQDAQDSGASERSAQSEIISVPWTKSSAVSAKGVLHSPSPSPVMSVDERDDLLIAIAKARTGSTIS